jgi:cell division protein FtsL
VSNLAYQTEPKRTSQRKQRPQIQKQQKRAVWITPGEKLLVFILLLFFGLGSITIVENHASIYQATNDVEQLKKQLNEQETVNNGLRNRIEDLKNPDRILQIAKEKGLTINENNVKMIQQ